MRETTSPFYSRNYGGLSEEQIEFLQPYIPQVGVGSILDPMAGQAHYLSQLSAQGYNVRLADLNPGPLMLAFLRDPRILRDAESLADWLVSEIKRFRTPSPAAKPVYCDDWIPTTSRRQLATYVEHLGLDRMGVPTAPSFWRANLKKVFAAAIPVLAARQIACYTSSDNSTWLKKGGLQTNFNVYSLIRKALEDWRVSCGPQTLHGKGSLNIRCTDAVNASQRTTDVPALIVTSPPYANRLDYTRLWAPELELLAAMFGFESKTIKDGQIGTTVVRGKSISKVDLESLPGRIQEALSRIRSDDLYASETYYYPFFANYAVSVSNTFKAVGHSLARNGRIVVFVRDTARKDVLFPVGELIESALRDAGVRSVVEKREVIVRSHVGMRRRDSHSSVHGLAQREWWTVLRKD